MKIGVIGATGKIGKCIFREALNRGIDVTAIIRDRSKVTTPDLQLLVKDAFELTVDDIKTFDVIVNAFGTKPSESEKHIELTNHLLAIFEEAPNVRLITIGTAGSLFIDDEQTMQVSESSKIPAILKNSFVAQTISLLSYKRSDSKWTYISPALFFDAAGTKTGSYMLGGDKVIFNSKGDSYISYYDLALAVVDEIENIRHIQQHMTAVSEMGNRNLITRLTNRTFQRILK